MRLDGLRQGPKVYARGPRRHSLWPLLTAVLLVHVAVLWGLQHALHSHGPAAKRERATALVYLPPPPLQRTAPQPPTPLPPPKSEDKPSRKTSPRVPPPAPPATTLTLQPDNPTTVHTPVAAAPPASAASEAAVPLLDTAATRQAIRDIAARPLNAERAAAVTGAAAPLSAEETMAQRAQGALKGDCAKGEFAGGGMGILSLPALAVAVARGDCRR